MRKQKAIFIAIASAAIMAAVSGPVRAADLKTGDVPDLMTRSSNSDFSSTLTVSTIESVAVGYLTPSSRSLAFGMLPGETMTASVSHGPSGGIALGDTLDISSSFVTDYRGSRFGVYGGVSDHPSTLSLRPGTAWNFGASVGYAGFYLRGGISDVSTFGLIQNREGWEAGFGYESGNLDLRLTYASSQSDVGLGVAEQQIDSRQWTIGGNYQISPRVRLNADAFYDMQGHDAPAFAVPNGVSAPQGTGARVGVQLRF
jgi:hypothetical protein